MAEVTPLPNQATKVSLWSVSVVQMLAEDGATDSEVIVACIEASLRMLKARAHLDGKLVSTRVAGLELINLIATMVLADSGAEDPGFHGTVGSDG